jgi:hypothetical protein
VLDLGQRPRDRIPLGQAGRLGEEPQRDDERERLVGGQPQRPVDAGVVGQRDPVTVERHVDEVARPVSGQPAHPQQLEVLAQLPVGGAEVAGRLGERDAGPALQVGHEVEQPAEPIGGGRHTGTLVPSYWPAMSCSRLTIASRTSGGSRTSTSAP